MNPNFYKIVKFRLRTGNTKYGKRNALCIDIFSKIVLLQKLIYIRQNPVRAGLVSLPENYFFSFAAFYILQDEQFDLISHHHG
jgi:hypothetical protein